jgi:hypothetical protein
MFLVFIVATFFRFIFYLTSPEDSKEDQERGQSLASLADQSHPTQPVNNIPFFRSTRSNVDVFGINLKTDDANGAPPNLSPPIVEEPIPNAQPMHSNQNDYASQEIPEDPRPPPANGNVQTDEFADDENLLKPPQMAGQRRSPSIYDTQSFGSQPIQLSVPSVAQQDDERVRMPYYEPKIAEQMALRSKGSVLNVLARNFKTIEKTTLYLAFFINVILLFHRVDIAVNSNQSNVNAPDDDEDAGNGEDSVDEEIYISGMTIPYFSYEITGWIFAQVSLSFFAQ